MDPNFAIYGAPPPGFEAPPPGFGAPFSGFGGAPFGAPPPPGFGAPLEQPFGYGAPFGEAPPPPPAFGAPDGFGAPPAEFGGEFGGPAMATRGVSDFAVPIGRGATVVLSATVPLALFNPIEFAEEVADAYNGDPTKPDKIAPGNVQILGIRASSTDPNDTEVNLTITHEQIPVMLTRAGRPRPRQNSRPGLLRRFGGRIAGIGFDSVVGGLLSSFI